MKLPFDRALALFILKHHRNLLIASVCSVAIIGLFSVGTYIKLIDTRAKINQTAKSLDKIKSSYAISTNLIQGLQGKEQILTSFLPNDFDLLVALSTLEEIGERTVLRI